MLWFFFKNSFLDNSIDIWSNCEQQLISEGWSKGPERKNYQEQWIGSKMLIQCFRKGMEECSFSEKMKIIYGFE